MPKFKVLGRVVKDSEAGVQTLASGSCIKEGESAEAVRGQFERDMKLAFPQGPDYNVEYHCVVEPVTAEPIGIEPLAERDYTSRRDPDVSPKLAGIAAAAGLAAFLVLIWLFGG